VKGSLILVFVINGLNYMHCVNLFWRDHNLFRGDIHGRLCVIFPARLGRIPATMQYETSQSVDHILNAAHHQAIHCLMVKRILQRKSEVACDTQATGNLRVRHILTLSEFCQQVFCIHIVTDCDQQRRHRCCPLCPNCSFHLHGLNGQQYVSRFNGLTNGYIH